ncbi:hypothetical protein F3D69_27095 [Bacteroides ovatus]|uniref:Uncharacterized protein n=1 Tax=Bacteroides ovatus TaxID=28116 RepID=A0A5M5D1E0_BACOV
MWQILYLQPICRRYLQRSNYLSISALHAFRYRWQMFLCFFGSSSNLVVISFLFRRFPSSSFLIL